MVRVQHGSPNTGTHTHIHTHKHTHTQIPTHACIGYMVISMETPSTHARHTGVSVWLWLCVRRALANGVPTDKRFETTDVNTIRFKKILERRLDDPWLMTGALHRLRTDFLSAPSQRTQCGALTAHALAVSTNHYQWQASPCVKTSLVLHAWPADDTLIANRRPRPRPHSAHPRIMSAAPAQTGAASTATGLGTTRPPVEYTGLPYFQDRYATKAKGRLFRGPWCVPQGL